MERFWSNGREMEEKRGEEWIWFDGKGFGEDVSVSGTVVSSFLRFGLVYLVRMKVVSVVPIVMIMKVARDGIRLRIAQSDRQTEQV